MDLTHLLQRVLRRAGLAKDEWYMFSEIIEPRREIAPHDLATHRAATSCGQAVSPAPPLAGGRDPWRGSG